MNKVGKREWQWILEPLVVFVGVVLICMIVTALVKTSHSLVAGGLVLVLLTLAGIAGWNWYCDWSNRLVDDSIDVHKPQLVPERNWTEQFTPGQTQNWSQDGKDALDGLRAELKQVEGKSCGTCGKPFYLGSGPKPDTHVAYIGQLDECQDCWLAG